MDERPGGVSDRELRRAFALLEELEKTKSRLSKLDEYWGADGGTFRPEDIKSYTGKKGRTLNYNIQTNTMFWGSRDLSPYAYCWATYCAMMAVVFLVASALLDIRYLPSPKANLALHFAVFLGCSACMFAVPAFVDRFLVHRFAFGEEVGLVRKALRGIPDLSKRREALAFCRKERFLLPDRTVGYALAFVFSYLCFEVFFIGSWAGGKGILVWEPEWAVDIAQWVKNNLDYPQGTGGRFVISVDSDMEAVYGVKTVEQAMQLPILQAGFLLFYIRQVVFFPLLACLTYAMWKLMDGEDMQVVNLRYVKSLGSFLRCLIPLPLLFTMVFIAFLMTKHVDLALIDLDIHAWFSGGRHWEFPPATRRYLANDIDGVLLKTGVFCLLAVTVKYLWGWIGLTLCATVQTIEWFVREIKAIVKFVKEAFPEIFPD